MRSRERGQLEIKLLFRYYFDDSHDESSIDFHFDQDSLLDQN